MSKRILVVEDQEDNRQVLRDLLSSADFEVIEAADGETGLAAAAAHRPDLILMDIQLPGLGAHRIAAASNALAGRLEDAHGAMVRLREADPSHRVSNVKDRIPLRRPQDLARLEDGLRKAGLPE